MLKTYSVKSLILYLVLVLLLISGCNSADEAAANENQSEETEGIGELLIGDLIAAGEEFKPTAEYYVSIQGDDGADGLTSEGAFLTIGHALNIVKSGEALYILPGIYNEAVEIYDRVYSPSPVLIQGVGDGVILDGDGDLTMGIWCEGCAGIIIQNIEIRNYTDIGIGFSASSLILIDNLKVHDNGFNVKLVDWEIEGYGIHVEESQKVVISANDVYQNGPNPRPFGMVGTGINTFMCHDCIIRDNRSYDNIGGGILVEDSVNVLVEDNWVTGNYLDVTEDEWWDGGIWLDGGHDVTVRNNLFQDNLGPGIVVSDEDNQEPYGYVLENNISTGNYYGIYIWNFGSTDFPPDSVLLMVDNQISGNDIDDVMIDAWPCPPDDPCD